MLLADVIHAEPVGCKVMRRATRFPKFARASFLSISLLILGIAPSCATLETAGVPIPEDNWKVGFYSAPGQKLLGLWKVLGLGSGSIMELIPEDDSIWRWDRLITIQFFEGLHKNPAAFAIDSISSLQKLCPELTWTVLKEETNSVTYVWSITNCEDQDSQEELVRILRGNDGLHRVAYSQKPKISPVSRSKWLDMIEGTILFKDGKPVEFVREQGLDDE